MEKKLLNINLVILANNHNPAIPTKDWLIQKSIFSKEPINFVNTIVLSIFENNKYVLEITDKRLTLIVKQLENVNLSELSDIIKKYVEALPETPYSAIGYNCHYIFTQSPSENIFNYLKERFCNNNNLFNEIIGNSDYKYGYSLLYNEDEIQISIQVIPDRLKNIFELKLNFHKDIISTSEKVSNLISFSDNLIHYHKKGKELIQKLFKGNINE